MFVCVCIHHIYIWFSSSKDIILRFNIEPGWDNVLSVIKPSKLAVSLQASISFFIETTPIISKDFTSSTIVRFTREDTPAKCARDD